MVQGPSQRRCIPSKYIWLCICGAGIYLISIIILIFMKHDKSASSFSSLSYLRNRKYQHVTYNKHTVIRPVPRNLNLSQASHHDYDITSTTSTYPSFQSLLSILEQWPPDEPDYPHHQRPIFQETLQHFNYSCPIERKMAEAYRNAELPFKLYDVPDIDKAGDTWSDDYLIRNIPTVTAHIEESKSNHFMFWRKSKHDASSTTSSTSSTAEDPPTNIIDMKLEDWLPLAYAADVDKIAHNTTHYYYMLGVAADDHSFINHDLPLFNTQPSSSSSTDNFFITNGDANKGIQCRFGMRGIIAEAHFDSGRNMVAMIHGAKRYILVPPSSCHQLNIITDPSHPSYRHSAVDWSNMEEARQHDFMHVPAIDTVVQQGEVLYIPSFWFHYIISLQYSIQCNSRSGTPPDNVGEEEINRCFGGALHAKGKKKLAGVAPMLNRHKKAKH